jgi:S1-C subfamily serine protease
LKSGNYARQELHILQHSFVDDKKFMTETPNWEIPAAAQPDPAKFDFDLEKTLSSVVAVHARIPQDAYTAGILGEERQGNGVVISDLSGKNNGLVLTIGYLITEATDIWLTTNAGTVVQADVLAYDQTSGFGLLQAMGRLNVPAIERGSSNSTRVGEAVIFAGHGGPRKALAAIMTDKREFAGYWEYVLDMALFTTPAYPHWGGAAVIGQDGKLLGLGSLYIQDVEAGTPREGNMAIPIELLEPILADMTTYGQVQQPPRPWMGLFANEASHHAVVMGVAENGPADLAGIESGDIIVDVAGEPVNGLASFFRTVWQQGPAGVEIPLTVLRNKDYFRFAVITMDRNELLLKPAFH